MYCSILVVAPIHGSKAYQLANIPVQQNQHQFVAGQISSLANPTVYSKDQSVFLSSEEIRLNKAGLNSAAVFKFQKRGAVYRLAKYQQVSEESDRRGGHSYGVILEFEGYFPHIQDAVNFLETLFKSIKKDCVYTQNIRFAHQESFVNQESFLTCLKKLMPVLNAMLSHLHQNCFVPASPIISNQEVKYINPLINLEDAVTLPNLLDFELNFPFSSFSTVLLAMDDTYEWCSFPKRTMIEVYQFYYMVLLNKLSELKAFSSKKDEKMMRLEQDLQSLNINLKDKEAKNNQLINTKQNLEEENKKLRMQSDKNYIDQLKSENRRLEKEINRLQNRPEWWENTEMWLGILLLILTLLLGYVYKARIASVIMTIHNII